MRGCLHVRVSCDFKVESEVVVRKAVDWEIPPFRGGTIW